MATGDATRQAPAKHRRGVEIPRAARRHAPAAGAAALVLLATVLAVRGYDSQRDFGRVAVGAGGARLYAIVAVAPAVLLVGAGVLAHWSRPASRIGLLLIAEGLAWNIGTLAFSSTYVPAAAEVSTLVVFLGPAIGAHVLLAYPTGRLRDRGDRVLAGLMYLVFGPGLAVTFLFHAAYGPGCSLCTANGFLLTPNGTLDIATNAGWYAAGAVLITLAGLRSVPRWRAAGVVARRSLAPVYLTRWALVVALGLWCAVGAALVVADTTLWGLRLQIAINLAAVAAAAGIVVVFMRSTAARGAAGELARSLDASDPLETRGLQDAIRAALNDPGARLLFRRHAAGPWLAPDGRPASTDPERSITPVAAGSAIEHDPVLDDDPGVVEAVAAVAGLALETERLRTLLVARDDGERPTADVGDVLTDRECEVLVLVAEGLTDAAIAQRLYLTRRTVETHVGHIFTKLDVPAGSANNRRVHAVRRFLDAGETQR